MIQAIPISYREALECINRHDAERVANSKAPCMIPVPRASYTILFVLRRNQPVSCCRVSGRLHEVDKAVARACRVFEPLLDLS